MVTKSTENLTETHFVCVDWPWGDHCRWIQWNARLEECAEVVGRSFRVLFRALTFRPLFAFAGFRHTVDGQVLLSPKPNLDCFVTVGADKHTGCMEFDSTSLD